MKDPSGTSCLRSAGNAPGLLKQCSEMQEAIKLKLCGETDRVREGAGEETHWAAVNAVQAFRGDWGSIPPTADGAPWHSQE